MWQQVQPAAAGSSSPSRRREDDEPTNCSADSILHNTLLPQNGDHPIDHLRRKVVFSRLACRKAPCVGQSDAHEECDVPLPPLQHWTSSVGYECSIPQEVDEGSGIFMWVPSLFPVKTRGSSEEKFQCVKEGSGQLGDMQTPKSLVDRSSVEAANANNTTHSAGAKLFRNYWSQPKKRKLIDVSNNLNSLAHESPTKRKAEPTETEIRQLECGTWAESQVSLPSSGLTSEHLMEEKESSRSSTGDEFSGHPATDSATSLNPTDADRGLSPGPRGKKRKVQGDEPEFALQSFSESRIGDPNTRIYQGTSFSGEGARPGLERQFYPQMAVLPVTPEERRGFPSQWSYQREESELQLDLNINTGGSGSGSKRRPEELGNEGWLQLGIGSSSKAPSASTSNLELLFEGFRPPVSRSPSAPSAIRYSPSVPSGGLPSLEREPLEMNFLRSLTNVPMQGHPFDFSSERQRVPVGVLASAGVVNLQTAHSPHPSNTQSWFEPQSTIRYPGSAGTRVLPLLPLNLQAEGMAPLRQGNFSSVADISGDQMRGVQQSREPHQAVGVRSHGPNVQWTARDPYDPSASFPFAEREFSSEENLRIARQPFGHIASGQGSSQRVEVSQLVSGLPRVFPPQSRQKESGSEPSGAGASGPSRPQSSERGTPQDQRARLLWSHEVPSTSEPRRGFPNWTGPVRDNTFQNLAMERLLERVGPANAQFRPPLGLESETQDVNLATYKRMRDQYQSPGPPPSWVNKERAKAEAGVYHVQGGAGPSSRRGQRLPLGAGPSQEWPLGGFLHLSPERGRSQEQLGVGQGAAIKAPNPGLWFRLEAEQQDESMPASMVKKFIAEKLGLADESEVDISCNDREVQPGLSLQHVRDQIWQAGGMPPRMSPMHHSSSTSPEIDSILRQGQARENSDGSISSSKDVVMVMKYRRHSKTP